MTRRNSALLTISALLLMIVMSAFQPARASTDAQATQPATPQRAGKIIADTGFRPGKDGFSFANYTNRSNPENLTPQDMYSIFGEAVCAQVKDGVCKLTPIAQQQMEKTNALMNGGHCDGMAALALLIYQNTVKASQFGGGTANAIPFDGNGLVQREIARWFLKQTVDPLYGQKLRFINEKITPSIVLDTLIKSMTDRSELYVVQVFRKVNRNWEGHAVTPYAIEELGNGLYHILVYDNNHPNIERFIEVNKTANTWKFTASTNPDAKNSVYEGDATTGTLMLLPLSLRLKPAQCTFCSSPATTGAVTPTAAPGQTPTYNEIIMDATSDDLSVLVKDNQGRRLGWEGDEFYNEIPGAYFVPIASQSGDYDDEDLWSDATEPLYYVPTGVAFTILIDGSELPEDAEEIASVSVFGPNSGVSVDEIFMAKGIVDELKFEADGKTFSYKSNTGESPEIFFGTNQPDADYGFVLQGVDLTADGEVNVKLDTTNRNLQVSAKNITETALFAIGLARIDETTEAEFYAEDIELEPTWVIAADWGNWKGKGDLNILIDTDGDLKFEKTEARKNQPKPEGAAYLQAASGGTFTHLKEDQYTLTLAQPTAITSYINSKPPYASAPMDTQKVVTQWTAGNAKAIAPAVLEIDRASIALELSEPHYDGTANTLTYLAKVRSITPVGNGRASKAPPGAFGASNLVIAENAALYEALTAGNKKLRDLIAGSVNDPDLNAGAGNDPDLNAGSVNDPDLNAGTLDGEFPLGYYQTARGGSLVKSGTGYTFTLNSAYPLIQVVSQAPRLGTAWVSSDAFHKVWNTYTNTTATALLTAGGKRILLRLNHPVSDPGKGTIVYQAQILNGEALDSFKNGDLLIASDSAFSAALTLSLNNLKVTLNAGSVNDPDLNAGAGNDPDLNAGSVNDPDLNAGAGNDPDLNAGGVNLIFGAEKTITPEMAKTCTDTLKGIATNIKALGGKLPDAATTAKLAQLDAQAAATCALSSQVFTPDARRQANGITSIALPQTR